MRIALCLSLIATSALASQIVVTDVTYTHSAQTTSDSHYVLVPPTGTPTNWVSPIDYSHGTAVVRLEVFTKPTNVATRFQICFDGSPSYACTDQAPAYTTTGVYTWSTPFPNFYQYNSVNWSQGVRNIALILKDTNNGKPAPENVGATESAKYMPTNLRVTVTLVSPGSTYVDPTVAVPDAGTPPVDAGVPVVDAGVPVVDAGVPVVDAGVPEIEVDAGIPEVVDAGQPEEMDAGAPEMVVDAGQPEQMDAGIPETPMPEPVVTEPSTQPPADDVVLGTGCSAGGVSLGLIGIVALMRRRRR